MEEFALAEKQARSKVEEDEKPHKCRTGYADATLRWRATLMITEAVTIECLLENPDKNRDALKDTYEDLIEHVVLNSVDQNIQIYQVLVKMLEMLSQSSDRALE